jgi:hypothetical protein
MCEIISSNPQSIDPFPRNMVLFMPYLHWDTDRQRNRFANEIEKLTHEWREKNKTAEAKAKSDRTELRKDLPRPTKAKPPSQTDNTSTWYERLHGTLFHGEPSENTTKKHGGNMSITAETVTAKGCADVPFVDPEQDQPWQNRSHALMDSSNSEGNCPRPAPQSYHEPSHLGSKDRIRSFSSMVERLEPPRKLLPVDKSGRMRVATPLGQYLIDAARLFEAMNTYKDRKLLQKYLHHNPPLHPRRTLDQAYYWSLNSTKIRDRDQVIYRSTTARPERLHQYCSEIHDWKEHKDMKLAPGESCFICRENIRKVSRVVMVDQLWMWILDGQTIITSFPKRYGSWKNDQSGVHKSIRMRLERARQNQIRSVFDLGLIILDECSNTFFNRAKTSDRQPQVIDTFAEAIGNLVSSSNLGDPKGLK